MTPDELTGVTTSATNASTPAMLAVNSSRLRFNDLSFVPIPRALAMRQSRRGRAASPPGRASWSCPQSDKATAKFLPHSTMWTQK